MFGFGSEMFFEGWICIRVFLEALSFDTLWCHLSKKYSKLNFGGLETRVAPPNLDPGIFVGSGSDLNIQNQNPSTIKIEDITKQWYHNYIEVLFYLIKLRVTLYGRIRIRDVFRGLDLHSGFPWGRIRVLVLFLSTPSDDISSLLKVLQTKLCRPRKL